MTSVADQEPGSQNGHRRPCTPKPVFTREVDQEFRLCSLQTSRILLAGRSRHCDSRQEGNQSGVPRQERPMIFSHLRRVRKFPRGRFFLLLWGRFLWRLPEAAAALNASHVSQACMVHNIPPARFAQNRAAFTHYPI